MKVTYIHHSGFLVETDSFYYIFDYYTGTVPTLDPDKKVIVFSSHAHADHYNPEIFSILSSMGMNFQAMLAKDISPKKYPEGIYATKVYANKTYEIENVKIETLQSTDAGVAFVVRDPEGVIYHSGDLNDWAWDGEPEQYNRQMTGSYRHEINKLANEKIDIAFEKEYHTDIQTCSGDEGQARFKGLYGKYEITVHTKDKTSTHKIHLTKQGTNKFTIQI